MSVFTALENLDGSYNGAVSEKEINSTIFGIMEDADEISILEAELAEMEASEEAFNVSLSQLDNLAASIEEFGICKPVIKAVDPDGYLEKAGIIPAFENLNDLPTKDENATISLEGIKETLKNAWTKIKEFLSKMWKATKNFFSKITGIFHKYEIVLRNLLDKIKKGTVNDKKFKEKKATIYKKSDYDELNSSIFTLSNILPGMAIGLLTMNKDVNTIFNKVKSEDDFNTIDEMIRKGVKSNSKFIFKISSSKDNFEKYLGLKVEEKEEKDSDDKPYKVYSFKTEKPSVKPSNSKISGEGWGVSDIEKKMDNALEKCKEIKKIDGIIKQLDNAYNTVESMYKSAIAATGQDDEKTIQKRNKVLSATKNMNNENKLLLKEVIKWNNTLIKQAITLGQAVVSSLE